MSHLFNYLLHCLLQQKEMVLMQDRIQMYKALAALGSEDRNPSLSPIYFCCSSAFTILSEYRATPWLYNVELTGQWSKLLRYVIVFLKKMHRSTTRLYRTETDWGRSKETALYLATAEWSTRIWGTIWKKHTGFRIKRNFWGKKL